MLTLFCLLDTRSVQFDDDDDFVTPLSKTKRKAVIFISSKEGPSSAIKESISKTKRKLNVEVNALKFTFIRKFTCTQIF